jgi:hypothetical protein
MVLRNLVKQIGFGWALLGSFVFAALPSPAFAQDAEVTLRHAHGLGYSADGRRIKIPNHYGIAVHTDGRWSMAPGAAHDYMGFVVTRDFIFSSGHFSPGGGRGGAVLGLMRSRDGGKSWTVLGFENEAEFHLVAAGYETNALYVYSPAPNSRMPRPGLYRMVGEGLEWRIAEARGMRGEVFKLTVHPTDQATLAAATSDGLFLSRNGGDEFQAIIKGPELRTAYFPIDGDALWFGTFDGRPGLFRIALTSGAREEIVLPPIGRDAVSSIAQNPARRSEFAIVTFERTVFVTPDRGKTWMQIAQARGTFPDGTMPGKGGIRDISQRR